MRGTWQFWLLAPLVGVYMSAIIAYCPVEIVSLLACAVVALLFSRTSIRLGWIV